MRKAGKLIIVPTPIGNLGDITLRALDALRAADFIYAEDTRVTGKLLSALDIPSDGRLRRLDENVLAQKAPEVCELIADGASIAYCTDAGMPGVSDPGLRLVAQMRERNLPVEVLPGASAAINAYVLSGAASPAFYFGGFLPRKPKDQAALLESLSMLDAALIFYESPKRLVRALQSIAETLPYRRVSVCRELTKLHEETVRGTASEVLLAFADRERAGGIKGEIAIVIDGPSQDELMEDALAGHSAALEGAEAMAYELADEGQTQKSIMSAIMDEFDIPRNEAYEIALNAKSAR